MRVRRRWRLHFMWHDSCVLIFRRSIHAVLHFVHGRNDFVPHVQTQFPQLALLYQRPVLALPLPRRRPHPLPPLHILRRQIISARWLIILLQGRGSRDGSFRGRNGWLLHLCEREDIVESCLTVTFAFPALPLCCLLAFMSLRGSFVLPGAFARIGSGSRGG